MRWGRNRVVRNWSAAKDTPRWSAIVWIAWVITEEIENAIGATVTACDWIGRNYRKPKVLFVGLLGTILARHVDTIKCWRERRELLGAAPVEVPVRCQHASFHCHPLQDYVLGAQ